jgi:hypothetical protein
MDSSNAQQQPALDPEAPNFAPAQPSSTGNFQLPDFWPDQPENWFAMAEAQFRLRRVSSNVDKYFLSFFIYNQKGLIYIFTK